MINAAYEIETLLKFGCRKNMISYWDIIPTRNALMDLLKVEAPYEEEVEDSGDETPVNTLTNILDYAYEVGIIEDNTITERDLLDARIMGLLMPRQSEINRSFYEKVNCGNIKEATDEFYELCKSSNYIMTERIAKNQKWYTGTEYGDLEITINLSKPEKDPKEIANAKHVKQSSYPKCLLCVENIGYAGRLNHPARQNLRAIPLTLAEEQWYFQYSPYLYYNEHCIVFKGMHDPMKLTEKTLERLTDFVDLFPHYFIGSNADLPIVGGSILTHDHYQGGRHQFPMEMAETERKFTKHKFANVDIGTVKWPMSVIRVSSCDKEKLVEATMYIFNSWKNYSDRENHILAFTGDTPHNTVTPIVRRKNGAYEIDLVLRNNRTTDNYPDGIFHPHSNLHHIKKENIGLIEVMGLAVLPGRLDKELMKIAEILSGTVTYDRSDIEKDSDLSKHIEWVDRMVEGNKEQLTMEEAENLLKKEVGIIFSKVLEDAGVFKRNTKGKLGFERFLASIDILE